MECLQATQNKKKKEISSSTNFTHRFHTKRNRPHSQWFYVSPLAKVCMTHCPVVHRRGIWDGFLPTYTTYGNPIVLSHTSLDAFSANLKMDVRFTYLMNESILLVLTFTGYIAVYFGATTQQHVSSRSSSKNLLLTKKMPYIFLRFSKGDIYRLGMSDMVLNVYFG